MEEFFSALFTLSQTAGPFAAALTLFLWWLERQDRKVLQRERDALLERVLTTNHQMAAGVEKISEGLKMAYDLGKEIREAQRHSERAGRP